MDSKRERDLEECVLRILKHGDPTKLTESKVRKLAAEETGFNLTDPTNRKLVKRTVENFFMAGQGGGSHAEKKARTKVVDRKAAAKRPSSGHRRKLVAFDEEEEEEVAEPQTRGIRAKESDDEKESFKTAMKNSARSRNPGRNLSRENAVDPSDSEELEQPDVSEESEDEDGRTRSKRVAKEKRADDTDDDEDTDRINVKKHALQRPAKRGHFSSDEGGSDADSEEEEEERSRKRKTPASLTNKQRRTFMDEDDVGEMRSSKARPQKSKTGGDDGSVCQLSKNRFVSVQNFNGKVLVSIREFYEKDGKSLPSKKGISLTVEQWEALKEGIPDIEEAIDQFS